MKVFTRIIKSTSKDIMEILILTLSWEVAVRVLNRGYKKNGGKLTLYRSGVSMNINRGPLVG
jgi:hypothetical protein